MKPVALIDMDGTLADMHGRLMAELVDVFPVETLSRVDPIIREKVEDLIKSKPGFWESLEPLPDGFLIVEELRRLDFALHILTRAPKRNMGALSEKGRWVRARKELGDVNITLTHDKSLVYGRVLVDDWPAYIKPWLKHRPRGVVVMPAWDYNQRYEHPQVLRFNGQLDELRERLRWARHR